MYPHIAQVFMDVGYVRELSKGHPGALPDPQSLARGFAVEARCAYIVTFNLRDFAGVEQFGLRAITPGQFLTLLGDAA